MSNPDRPGVGRQREKAGLSHAALGQNSTDWWQDEMGVEGGCGQLFIVGGMGRGDPHQALDMWAWSRGRYGYLSLRNGCISPACLFPGHQPEATSGAVGASPGEVPPSASALCPYLSFYIK